MRPTKKNLKKLSLIHFLKDCKPCQRKNVFQFLDSDSLEVVFETIHNLIYHNAHLNKRTRNRIRKQFESKRKLFQTLANKSKPVNAKRRILVQEGAGWGLLFKIAAALLSGLLFKSK